MGEGGSWLWWMRWRGGEKIEKGMREREGMSSLRDR